MLNRPLSIGGRVSLWHLSRSSAPHKCRFHRGFSLGDGSRGGKRTLVDRPSGR